MCAFAHTHTHTQKETMDGLKRSLDHFYNAFAEDVNDDNGDDENVLILEFQRNMSYELSCKCRDLMKYADVSDFEKVFGVIEDYLLVARVKDKETVSYLMSFLNEIFVMNTEDIMDAFCRSDILQLVLDGGWFDSDWVIWCMTRASLLDVLASINNAAEKVRPISYSLTELVMKRNGRLKKRAVSN